MATARRPARSIAALSAVAALLLAGCGGGDDPTVDVAPDEDVPATETEETEETEEVDGAGALGDDAGDAEADAATADGATDGGATDDDAVGPTPDPALVADPCASEQGRESDGFITVVSPVADQLVDGAVELVGCSNVFEANVQWTLYDGDGRELDAGFTTAECGSGCVGAFREEIPLDAAEGEPTAELHVYSEDASGGESGEADEDGRLHLVAIPLVLG